MYSADVSPDLISPVTDSIVAEVTAWQSRPLERHYDFLSWQPGAVLRLFEKKRTRRVLWHPSDLYV